MSEPGDDNNESSGDGGIDDPWAEAFAEQENAEVESSGDSADAGDSQLAGLDELIDDQQPGEDNVDLDMILDIPVTISMEIGRTRISIRNLLKLNQGSVVELDRLAGEPLDVLVNGTLIAHGEVVVVNEKFGIRLTDVITAMERIQKLR